MMRAALLAAALACGPATAQAQPAPSIVGDWVFEAPLDPDRTCIITGRARVSAGRDARSYAVRISSHERCEAGGEWRAEQLCAATREADRLSIDCNLVSATPTDYVDDDFALQIHSRERMDGWLISLRRGRALWRRPEPPPIS
jgi:hypothetical protein